VSVNKRDLVGWAIRAFTPVFRRAMGAHVKATPQRRFLNARRAHARTLSINLNAWARRLEAVCDGLRLCSAPLPTLRIVGGIHFAYCTPNNNCRGIDSTGAGRAGSGGLGFCTFRIGGFG